MRGKSATQATMLTAVTPDALVPQGHPIRRIKPMVDSALAGLSPMVPSSGRITVGADRGYDTRDFVWDCRDMHITPHVAQRRHSAIDGRTTRHGGYRLSQRVRKRVEEVFGWVKTVGGGRKLRYLGVGRNQMWAELTVAGYNLVRLARLAQSPA